MSQKPGGTKKFYPGWPFLRTLLLEKQCRGGVGYRGICSSPGRGGSCSGTKGSAAFPPSGTQRAHGRDAADLTRRRHAGQVDAEATLFWGVPRF